MSQPIEIRLTGIRGDNPLGFLAALGAFATLDSPETPCRLKWDYLSPILSWAPPVQPTTAGGSPCSSQPCQTGHRPLQPAETRLVEELHTRLFRQPLCQEISEALSAASKQAKKAATAVKNKEKEIKKRRLERAELKQARDKELPPLLEAARQAQAQYRRLLGQVRLDPVLTLGDNLTAANEEWVEFVERVITSGKETANRRDLALLASFGIGDPNRPDEQMFATPWALLRGAGHQHFLGTVRELVHLCTPCHYAKALFGPWIPSDERLSLRLDPAEDRRYALMAADPTSADNTPRTLWGANRLAFEGLQFFPAYPSHPVAFAAWRNQERGNWVTACQIRWPLWRHSLSADAVRSLLLLPVFWSDLPLSQSGGKKDSTSRRNNPSPSLTARQQLNARGVFAVFSSSRILNDKFYNLTPGAPLWTVI